MTRARPARAPGACAARSSSRRGPARPGPARPPRDLVVAQRQRLDVGMVEVAEMDLAGGAGRGGGHVSRPASADSGPARARTRSRPRSRRRRGASRRCRVVPEHALDALRRRVACRRRRSRRRHAASSPCRRRRRGASETQVAPPAVLSSAFSSGQSETASLPSRIASVSRFGLRDRAGVEVVAADHDRRLQLARLRPSR